ncbi:carbohydrate ABC transporter permease [Desulfonema ishimotonii]|uniref:sn-glycerol-3-phosphate transport system permease protein UgpE n=1 Tax=Desulfonema ishimotonii TaxID=45657 RepID=A0A401FV12_9BACT|nr:carbohydrate ABC transporter permease [Desulfonema ishimotonii]GBC60795.1 carbohydrate ABC transporter permease [Desulfonema ishimotonii]
MKITGKQAAVRGAQYLALILGALLYTAPILCMVAGSLKPDERVLAEAGSWRAFVPGTISFDNYADVFNRVAFGRFMLNSLIITGTVVASGLIVNSLAGYAFARLKWRGRGLLFGFVLSLMILPFEAIAVPLFYQITLLGWRDTYIAQILPFVANAFSVYLFHTAFIGLPPELEESAYVDGAGVFRTFAEIVVPNARPVFASVAILTFLMHWGIFLWPLMVTSGERVRPLAVAIAAFHTLPPLKWGDIMAFGVMMVSPVLILFIIFQKAFVRGIASTGTRG